MRRKAYFLFLPLFFFGIYTSVFAQGTTCASLDPFCAGSDQLVFPNSNINNSTVTNGQPGPTYGCLLSQPYPAWFYLQVEKSGNLRFNISQFQNKDGSGSQYDVDFVVWGPFKQTDDYCADESLSAENIIDCSYEPDTEEEMIISNAEEGQIYVVMITNYDELPGFISLKQTNSQQSNSGSTDCGILDEVLGPDRMLCGVNETVLDATTQGVARYEWYGFDELANNFKVISNETNPTLKITKSGRYKVIVYAKQTNQPDEDEIEVQFFSEPVASKPKDIFICDPAQNTIDLTVNSNDILTGNTSEENYLVNFYESLQQLKAENPISNPKSYQIEETQEILAVVAGEESGCASDLVRFQVEVSFVPEALLAEETVICIDLAGNITQQSKLGRDLGSNYSYIWSAEGNSISTAPIFNFSQVPSFDQLKLQVTDTRSGCSVEFQTKLLVYSKAETVSVKIEGSDFTGGTTVTADAKNGTGENTTYEYRADNGSWQESASFSNLKPGYHTISAREINGCGITVSPKFYLVGYQRFFTPNSDGYNDTWNITGNNEIKILKLYVFDRYGKLLKEIIPGGGAWDGTYNGRNLPANDYWFKVTYEMNGGKRGSFSANFTLKR